jgi:hypothetical protein
VRVISLPGHNAVISPIGVGHQSLPIILQEVFRSVPAKMQREVEDARSTEKPLSGLKNVTRSTSPAISVGTRCWAEEAVIVIEVYAV